MDSDAWHFGGRGRVAWDSEHFTTPATEEEGGKFQDRDQYFQVMRAAEGIRAAEGVAVGWAGEVVNCGARGLL